MVERFTILQFQQKKERKLQKENEERSWITKKAKVNE